MAMMLNLDQTFQSKNLLQSVSSFNHFMFWETDTKLFHRLTGKIICSRYVEKPRYQNGPKYRGLMVLLLALTKPVD